MTSDRNQTSDSTGEHADANAFAALFRVLTAHSVGETFTLERSCVSQISSPFQFMIPALLQREHAEWKEESLDDFLLSVAWLEDRLTLAFLGLAQLITTQEYVHACVWLSARDGWRGFRRLRCGLGVEGDGRFAMETMRWNSPHIAEALHKLRTDPTPRDWVYTTEHDYGPTGFYFPRTTNAR